MQEIKYRYYQEDALKAITDNLHVPGNDLVVLPTGAGKSIVISGVANHINSDVLILQPSKEILEQNAAKLALYVDHDEIGIYSASLDSKDIKKYTFATIGSIYTKPELFNHFKVVLIDECHSMNPKDTGSMFSSFIKGIGNPKVIGFTATPYRNMTGYHKISKDELKASVTLKLICRIQPQFWARIIYNINNAELVEKGYLTPIRYTDASLVKQEEIPLNKNESDFDIEKYDNLIMSKHDRLIETIKNAAETHTAVLVFTTTLASAARLSEQFENSASLSSKMPKKERERVINGFKDGSIKIVFNVGVLTTGFDYPALDCIVLNRPTRSMTLYYQMLGRGVRKFPGKEYCDVIDFTNTVDKLGKVESIRLVNKSPGRVFHGFEMWELKTETGDWHNRPLYSYIVDISKEK